jgi:hypothetical protein
MLGFEQTGFNSFQVTPRLPSDFDYLTIDKMHMGGSELSINLKKENNNVRISVKKDNKTIADKLVPSGKTINIKF